MVGIPAAFDLDACPFLITEDGRVRSDNDFIFYNHPKSTDGSVEHTGDNTTGEPDNEEIVRYDLNEDFSIETTMILGEVYRHGGGWKFHAVGQGFAGGLEALAKNFRVNV